MHRRNTLRCALAGIAMGAVIWVACGDDGPTGTGGGGGGGSNNTLGIPPGIYAAEIATWTCGQVDTMIEISGNEVFCETEVVEDFLDFPCPITRNGNTLSMDCSFNEPAGPGCTVNVTIDATGTVSGDTYLVTGTIMMTATPTGCVPNQCYGFRASVEKISDAPGACQYANQREVDATISGGPFAGSRSLDAGGSASVIGNTIAYSIFANEGTGPISKAAAAQSYSIYMSLETPYLDPQTLPQTLPAVAQPFGAQLLGGPEPVIIGYSENRDEPYHYFAADSVISGSVTVNELSAAHIAGTMNVVLHGLQVTQSGSSQTTRSIVGGYFVINEFGPAALRADGVESRARELLVDTIRKSFRFVPVE